jgi:hypothetical protein
MGKLNAIKAQAEANGDMDLVWLRDGGAGARTRARRGAGASSPSTGIIDSHAFILALLDAERHGAAVAFEPRFSAARSPAEGP